MQKAKFTSKVVKSTLEPFEALNNQVARPLIEEAGRELGSFFGVNRRTGFYPEEIAKEDLRRAREKENLLEKDREDNQASDSKAREFIAAIKEEYRQKGVIINKEQQEMEAEMTELQEEIAQLAKTAGVETKVHLQTNTKKIGILDIKLLRWIVRLLKVKAEESKSAQELAIQRTNAKRTTGMLAWVSGKQMKVHEQGTLQLQG